jgi:hypothetical protein
MTKSTSGPRGPSRARANRRATARTSPFDAIARRRSCAALRRSARADGRPAPAAHPRTPAPRGRDGPRARGGWRRALARGAARCGTERQRLYAAEDVATPESAFTPVLPRAAAGLHAPRDLDRGDRSSAMNSRMSRLAR